MPKVYIDLREDGPLSQSILVQEVADDNPVDGFIMSAKQYHGLHKKSRESFVAGVSIIEGTIPTLGREVIVI